jgi:protein-S-isoprenylcysteine O-methyltransferase Ste14
MTRSGRFFIFHSWWLLIYLLLLMVCVHLFVVYFEEPRLSCEGA